MNIRNNYLMFSFLFSVLFSLNLKALDSNGFSSRKSTSEEELTFESLVKIILNGFKRDVDYTTYLQNILLKGYLSNYIGTLREDLVNIQNAVKEIMDEVQKNSKQYYELNQNFRANSETRNVFDQLQEIKKNVGKIIELYRQETEKLKEIQDIKDDKQLKERLMKLEQDKDEQIKILGNLTTILQEEQVDFSNDLGFDGLCKLVEDIGEQIDHFINCFKEKICRLVPAYGDTITQKIIKNIEKKSNLIKERNAKIKSRVSGQNQKIFNIYEQHVENIKAVNEVGAGIKEVYKKIKRIKCNDLQKIDDIQSEKNIYLKRFKILANSHTVTGWYALELVHRKLQKEYDNCFFKQAEEDNKKRSFLPLLIGSASALLGVVLPIIGISQLFMKQPRDEKRLKGFTGFFVGSFLFGYSAYSLRKYFNFDAYKQHAIKAFETKREEINKQIDAVKTMKIWLGENVTDKKKFSTEIEKLEQLNKKVGLPEIGNSTGDSLNLPNVPSVSSLNQEQKLPKKTDRRSSICTII